MRLIDLTGKTFGRITVIKRSSVSDRHTKWECKCKCGKETEVYADALQRGDTTSCGCLRSEILSSRSTTHGHTRGARGDRSRQSPEYKSWCHMKSRCNTPSDPKYASYGNRGIKVCDRWLNSFQNFFDDMGNKHKGQTIERINNDGGYEPSNCCWASPHQQSRNTRNNVFVEWEGRKMILKDLAALLGIQYKRLHAWHRRKSLPILEAIAKCCE